MNAESTRSLEEKETGRVEAFSDGIFAFAITLLVFNLKVPVADGLAGASGLKNALLQEWPAFLSFFISFINILIMWVNHHHIFGYIRRIDGPLLFLNGFLLLTVTFVPFPTDLLADYIKSSYASTAVSIFAGSILMNCLSFVFLWAYVSRGKALIRENTEASVIKSIRRNGLIGLPLYLFAVILAFFNYWASIIICFLLAVFFSVTVTLKKK